MFKVLRSKRKSYEDGIREGYDKGYIHARKICEQRWEQEISNMAKSAFIELEKEFRTNVKVVREEASSYRLNGQGTMEIKQLIKLPSVYIRLEINPEPEYMNRIKTAP